MPREPRRETFEQLYARLEEQVAKLEQGGLPLEEAIALYEEGMTLARACQERLDEAELKITKLRESFASVPPSRDSEVPEQVDDDYEYVANDDGAGDPDDIE
jgi:exodeoxyribonuclease VII small subunit